MVAEVWVTKRPLLTHLTNRRANLCLIPSLETPFLSSNRWPIKAISGPMLGHLVHHKHRRQRRKTSPRHQKSPISSLMSRCRRLGSWKSLPTLQPTKSLGLTFRSGFLKTKTKTFTSIWVMSFRLLQSLVQYHVITSNRQRQLTLLRSACDDISPVRR